MHQNKFKIIKNCKINPCYYKLDVLAPEITKEAKCGQFVHVRIKQEGDKPFLRRPLAVHDVKEGKFLGILYKVRGYGTEVLSRKKEGETLDIIGPLGNGFDFAGNIKDALIVAGGIGVAPLLFLAKELVKRNRNITCFLGGACKEDILCEDEFKELKIKVIIATEDGSKGKKAKITDLLKEYLSKGIKSSYEIFSSGPKEMLKKVAKISSEYKIPAQVSLDEMIACGVGACLGCAIKTKNGYKLVCKDGPVFKAGDIVWK